MIWKKKFTLDSLNQTKDNLVKHLGIEFSAFGDDFLEATMPVDARTHQPYGILHGGASVVLAESLGSLAGYLCLEDSKEVTVGLEINANHIRSVREGRVIGKANALHLGRTTQIWQIEIREETTAKLICVSRMTLAVISK
ncbi:MAG: hotdog fold thioesterase [Chitinophagales bacterium]|nr:hotdog fold thioesterase [Chitinophagales bacterium]